MIENYNTRVTELLGIKYPIIQGGMAWVAEHNLASAVSNAGGLGIIAAANAPSENVKEEIRKAKAKTNKKIGVNLMLMSPYADEISQMVVEEGITVVTTGAGNPQKYIDMWKEAGIKIIPVISSVSLAKRLETKGVDAIIVEGMEAGGHIGQQTTMTLVPQVVDEISIPVIAAGGIGDGRGYAAAMMLGAEGVQIGTRFIVAHESIVHDNYKKKIVDARDNATIVTGSNTGHPVRVLKNRMSKEYLKMESNSSSFEALETLTSGALRKAVQEGEVINGSLMAGQIAGLISKRLSCKEIIDEIIMEAVMLL